MTSHRKPLRDVCETQKDPNKKGGFDLWTTGGYAMICEPPKNAPNFFCQKQPFMMLVGLGTALWGASSFPHASAFALPAILSSAASNAFVSRRSAVGTSATAAAPRRRRQHQHNNAGSSSSGGTVMLFDFIKKRAQEGVEQTQNLVTAAQTGRLDEALKETSAYVKDRRVSEQQLLCQPCLSGRFDVAFPVFAVGG